MPAGFVLTLPKVTSCYPIAGVVDEGVPVLETLTRPRPASGRMRLIR